MRTTDHRTSRDRSVVVIGLGNIGSHLVPHLARLPPVARLVLVDPDTYDANNLQSQDFSSSAVGGSKVAVQARRLRQINPHLRIDTLPRAVETVPMGRLRGAVILACVDSRAARQTINQIAWRLGVPWIDAGVEPRAGLARVNAYLPGPSTPCLECAWGDDDYAHLDR